MKKTKLTRVVRTIDIEGVTVVCHKADASSGGYEYPIVVDHFEHRIFRDAGGSGWYDLQQAGGVHSSSMFRFLGFTKDDAIASLVHHHKANDVRPMPRTNR